MQTALIGSGLVLAGIALGLGFGADAFARGVDAPVVAAQPAPAAPYTEFDWVAPQPGQTIHDNSGDVRVELALTPPLQTSAGHRMLLALDGRPLPERWKAQSFVVTGIDRGEHRLQAFVVAADGRRLAASEPLTFQLWHASRLFPQRHER